MERRAIVLALALGAAAVGFVLGRGSRPTVPAPPPATIDHDVTALATAIEELRRDLERIATPPPAPAARSAIPDATSAIDARLAQIEETLAMLVENRGDATAAGAATRDLRRRIRTAPKRIDRLLALFREFGAEDLYDDSPLTERFRFLTAREVLVELGRPDGIQPNNGGGVEWSYQVETTDVVGRDALRRAGASRSFYTVCLHLAGGMVLLVTGTSEKRV
ncbi:MAG: hypothetical protein AAF628_25815 [Planctomycetota bacterium]